VTLGGWASSAVFGRLHPIGGVAVGGGKTFWRTGTPGRIAGGGGAYDVSGSAGGAGAPSSKSAAKIILNGPPKKQMIEAIAVRISMKAEPLNEVKTPRIGTTTTPAKSIAPPCRTPLRLGDISRGPSAGKLGNIPLLCNRWITPSSRKPQRGQNLMTSEACC